MGGTTRKSSSSCKRTWQEHKILAHTAWPLSTYSWNDCKFICTMMPPMPSRFACNTPGLDVVSFNNDCRPEFIDFIIRGWRIKILANGYNGLVFRYFLANYFLRYSSNPILQNGRILIQGSPVWTLLPIHLITVWKIKQISICQIELVRAQIQSLTVDFVTTV